MEKQILKSGYNVVGKRVYTLVNSSQIINPLFRKLYEMDDLNETQILRLIQTEYKPVRVRTNKDLKPSDIPMLLKGIEFEGDFLKADKIIPAPTDKEGDRRKLEVHLSHGKKREIRRIFFRLKIKLLSLKRIGYSNLRLGNLRIGEYRELNQKEIKSLYRT